MFLVMKKQLDIIESGQNTGTITASNSLKCLSSVYVRRLDQAQVTKPQKLDAFTQLARKTIKSVAQPFFLLFVSYSSVSFHVIKPSNSIRPEVDLPQLEFRLTQPSNCLKRKVGLLCHECDLCQSSVERRAKVCLLSALRNYLRCTTLLLPWRYSRTEKLGLQ